MKKKYKTKHDRLPLEAITVLPQMRQTVVDQTIAELADNIFEHGLIYPLCVAEVDGSYILIAGHRRRLAIKKLIVDDRLSPNYQIPVVIFYNLSSIDRALLQASENIHESVPPHEAANFYKLVWEQIKEIDPRFTLKKFAQTVGRSESTIHKAIRFCLLPRQIQKMVREGQLRYGIALELGKLTPYLNDRDLTIWAVNAVIARDNIDSIKSKVTILVQDRKFGQVKMDLFDLVKEKKTIERQSRRMLFDHQLTFSFLTTLEYWRNILRLVKKRKLTKKDFPSSTETTKRNFKKTVSTFREILPYLKEWFPRTSFEHEEELLLVLEKYIDLLKED